MGARCAHCALGIGDTVGHGAVAASFIDRLDSPDLAVDPSLVNSL